MMEIRYLQNRKIIKMTENSVVTKLIEKFDVNSRSSDSEEFLAKEQLPPPVPV